jgi:hypothetical protein
VPEEVQRPVANTVYRDRAGELGPVALIDWDIAAPGRRIHDIAHVCWQYAGLGPEIEDTAQACWQIRIICDASGNSGRFSVVLTRLARTCRRGRLLGRAEPGRLFG